MPLLRHHAVATLPVPFRLSPALAKHEKIEPIPTSGHRPLPALTKREKIEPIPSSEHHPAAIPRKRKNSNPFPIPNTSLAPSCLCVAISIFRITSIRLLFPLSSFRYNTLQPRASSPESGVCSSPVYHSPRFPICSPPAWCCRKHRLSAPSLTNLLLGKV